MRLTVLGSAASFAGPGQACAGHLLEAAGSRVLLDCGNGVVANLGRVIDPLTLDAVFITHDHPDHFLDVYALQALLRYAPEGPAAPLELRLPTGLFERMQCILSQRGAGELAAAFDARPLVAEEPVAIGRLTITPRKVDHTDHSYALVAADGVATLCYTSDTSPGEATLRAACGCDLLLAEATLPEAYEGRAPHLTARQAGVLAREAGAGALVLTHVWATNDRALAASEAAAEFAGPVMVATELETYEVTPASTQTEGIDV